MRAALLMCSLIVVSACAAPDRITAPVLPEAAEVGTTQTVFFATTQAKQPDGHFGIDRSRILQRGVAEVSLPPNRQVGSITYGFDDPDPQTDFVFADLQDYEAQTSFQSALRRDIAQRPRDEREVSVYVHGFNTSFSEALFRMAQMKTDLQIPGTSVAYTWPSRASPLGYEYDEDSALFARNGLESLLRDVNTAGSSGIVLVAHSMGSLVVMETLRQIERASPGWAGRNLSGIVLISPDLDLDLFRSQMADLSQIPEPFIIFTSQRDRALGLSALITGEEERLGNLRDVRTLSDLPVTILNVTALSNERGLNHFIPGSSPTLIAMVREARQIDPEFMRGDIPQNTGLLNANRRSARNATELVIQPVE